jgi:localization factor PodJL
VEQNLAESYKWFSLAAAQGDKESSNKREDVGARLDPQALMAAQLAVQTFVVELQPEEATSVKAPEGGWDRPSAGTAPVAPAKKRLATPRS